MTHSVTCKLNNDARQHQGAAGTTFFVSLGEKNYNHKTKQNEYTNYDAALFAKDAQVGFYASVLVKGAIVEVSGTGLLVEVDPSGQYKPKLVIQDAKLGFAHNDQVQSQSAGYQQQAPQQAPQQYQQPQPYQQAPQQAQNNGYAQAQNGAPQGNFQQPQR